MGSLFGGGKDSKSSSSAPISMEPAWQTAMRKKLAELATPGAEERITRAGEAYPGELTADLSSYEQTGLEQLGRYINSPSPLDSRLYGLGKAEVEKTLTGEDYDPLTGEFYKAYRENLMRELGEAKDRLASRTSARDKFYSGGRVAGEGELEETAQGQMRQTLGQLYEGERARRLNAVPLATEMLGFEERMPLGRIAASQQFGALSRQYEQAVLDAKRQEWLRQLSDLGIPLDVATAMSTYQPPMYFPQTTSGGGGGSSGLAGLGSLLGGVDWSGLLSSTGGGGGAFGLGSGIVPSGFLGSGVGQGIGESFLSSGLPGF